MIATPLLEVSDLVTERVKVFENLRPYIATGSVDAVGTLNTQMVSYADKPTRADLSVQAGDVCFARMAATDKAFTIESGAEGSILSTGFAVLRPHPDRLDPRYLMHWFRSARFRGDKDRLCTGSTQRAITNEKIKQLRVPVPPLREQRHVAALLDRVVALREMRRQTIESTSEVALAMVQEQLRREVEAKPVPLTEAFWFQEGPGVRKWQFRDAGVKLLNVSNILASGQLDLARTDTFLDEAEANGRYRHFLVDAGDLVVASSGIKFDSDGLLRTRGAFVSAQDLPLCMNTSTIRFKAVEGVSDLRFLQVWLRTREFRVQISRLVTGSAQQNFGPSHLKQIQITLPGYAGQQALADQLAQLNSHEAMLMRAQQELTVLRASLELEYFR